MRAEIMGEREREQVNHMTLASVGSTPKQPLCCFCCCLPPLSLSLSLSRFVVTQVSCLLLASFDDRSRSFLSLSLKSDFIIFSFIFLLLFSRVLVPVCLYLCGCVSVSSR